MWYKVKKAYIWVNWQEKQIYPAAQPQPQPVTTVWIYWSSDLWVISFQTSAWSGISIADKNIWATTVYNSWDTKTAANMGKWFQWWNNYWWLYWTNPTNTTSTYINASSYWPWNYYSSSTFFTHSQPEDYWDSSNNANLWWWTTNTYVARRWPCEEWWHIPSKDNATTLVNAISSITWSVDVSKILQYCKLPSTLPGISSDNWQWTNLPRCWITYSDNYNKYSCWMLYLPTSWSYIINENRRKSAWIPCRAFSNTFIQPTTARTKLN